MPIHTTEYVDYTQIKSACELCTISIYYSASGTDIIFCLDLYNLL